MRIDVITLFPEFFAGPLSTGLIGKAIESGIAQVGYVDPRAVPVVGGIIMICAGNRSRSLNSEDSSRKL